MIIALCSLLLGLIVGSLSTGYMIWKGKIEARDIVELFFEIEEA